MSLAFGRSELAQLMAFALEHAIVKDVQLAIRCTLASEVSLHEVLVLALERAKLNKSYLRAAFEWGARYGMAGAIDLLQDDPRPEVAYAVAYASAEVESIDQLEKLGKTPADVIAFRKRCEQSTLLDEEVAMAQLILGIRTLSPLELAQLLFSNPSRIPMLGQATADAIANLDLDSMLAVAEGGLEDASEPFIQRMALFTDPRAEQYLIDLSNVKRPTECLANALASMPTDAGIDRLIESLPSQNYWVVAALNDVPHSRLGPRLIAAYRRPGAVRRYGAEVVAEFAGVTCIPVLVDALTDVLREVRDHATAALVKLGEPALPLLTVIAESVDQVAREHAIRAVAAIGARESAGMLQTIANDARSPLRLVAIEGLSKVTGPAAEQALIALVGDKDRRVRNAATIALCAVVESEIGVVAVMHEFRMGDEALQHAAIAALVRTARSIVGPSVALDTLVMLYSVSDPEIRIRIGDALVGASDLRLPLLTASVEKFKGVPVHWGVSVDSQALESLDALVTQVRKARWIPSPMPEFLKRAVDSMPRSERPELYFDAPELPGTKVLSSPPAPFDDLSVARGATRFSYAAGTLHSPVDDKERHARTQATSAAPVMDESCYFSVAAPEKVKVAVPFIVELWCHDEAPDVFLRKNARQLGWQPVRSVGPVHVEFATEMEVKVHLPGFDIEEPSGVMRWEGRTGVLGFEARSSPGTLPGLYLGSARVAVGGIPIARVHFQIELGAASAAPIDCTATVQMINSAFASYASEDRNAVLGRIQGMQKILPNLNVFLDVVSLRSGDDWEKRIAEEIEHRDAFFLFWSRSAQGSRWVDHEWRTALRARGADFIDPVPLEGPELAPPPAELADRHFGDWTLRVERHGQR